MFPQILLYGPPIHPLPHSLLHPIMWRSPPSYLINYKTKDWRNICSSLIQSNPLRYAFADIPTFYPNHVCEFYYSCTFNPDIRSLQGTIAAGTQQVTISPSTIRNALRLPIFHKYLNKSHPNLPLPDTHHLRGSHITQFPPMSPLSLTPPNPRDRRCGYLSIPRVYKLGQRRFYVGKCLFPCLFVFCT